MSYTEYQLVKTALEVLERKKKPDASTRYAIAKLQKALAWDDDGEGRGGTDD